MSEGDLPIGPTLFLIAAAAGAYVWYRLAKSGDEEEKVTPEASL